MLARFAVLFIVLGMLAAAGAGSASVAVGAGADRAMARPIIRTPQPRPTVAILVATRTLEAPTVIPLATRTLEPPSAVPAATRTLTPPTLAPIFPTVTPQRPTQVPTIAHTPMMTALPVTVMPEYVAAEMVRAFAAECLGLNISVDRTYGATGNVNLPEAIGEEVEAAVSVAGQVSIGSISAGDRTRPRRGGGW